jgi:hypothetical protein
MKGGFQKKMRSKYVNKIVAILPIIYQQNKVQYFNNKFSMMIYRAHHGKFVNWATIMCTHLVKELIKWEKCQKNMIKEITKRKPKKDVCHYAIVLESMFQSGFHYKE